MPYYHVTIQGADRAAMADLVRTHDVTVVRQTLAEHDEGYTVSAIADTLLQFESAEHLRVRLGLSPAQTADALRRALTDLLT